MSAGITLVTRATGHLGANQVRRLLDQGEQVRVMMHSERNNGVLEAEMLAYESYWDAPPIELNPVVPMFQRLTARKWENYLERTGNPQTANAD